MSHLQTTYKKGGADEEFPILCETCLGDNPFIRMTKEKYGKACKICERPFTVYRWQPGARARYKKTELCHTCAKLKNVCQTCVLDLEYGLPVQVRDSALEEHEKMRVPKSDVNMGFLLEQAEREANGVGGVDSPYGKIKAPRLLERLSRRTPYYRRNLAHLCSFYAAGTCNRGALCPYRHEMPQTGELAHQNIKDRYYGQNDPVAKKMLRRAEESTSERMPPPKDQTITTLWVGGFDDSSITEGELRTKFYTYGELASIRMVEGKGCAFVTYLSRQSAEDAARGLSNRLVINGQSMRLAWGRPRAGASLGGKSGAVPPPPGMSKPGSIAPPPGQGPPVYPSQDPRNLAVKLGTDA